MRFGKNATYDEAAVFKVRTIACHMTLRLISRRALSPGMVSTA